MRIENACFNIEQETAKLYTWFQGDWDPVNGPLPKPLTEQEQQNLQKLEAIFQDLTLHAR